MIFGNVRAMAAIALCLAVPAGFPSPASAAGMPVFDATNYAQNVLQAARALEQINNQIRSLQYQSQMLANMAKNLERTSFPEIGQLSAAIGKVDALMKQGGAIDFRVDSLDRDLKALFPLDGSATNAGERVSAARARYAEAASAFQRSLAVQSQVVANIEADAPLLRDLAARSQDAAGALQVQQATNQLLAMSAKQQMQLQSLIAAEFRSQGLERARRLQDEADARAETQRFLGNRKAYQPR